MIQFVHKIFEDLSLNELYDLLKLRQEVFIVEQNCPYLDNDGLDKFGDHILGIVDDNLVAYARILPSPLQYESYTAIGRVLSAQKIRNQNIGRQLFEFTLKKCIELYPDKPIKLSSQVYIKAFYAAFGFKEINAPYLEDNIPHIAMTYNKHL